MLPESSHLPQPDADAMAHSQRLVTALRLAIAAAGGWLDFAGFMHGLLFQPGLGYYVAGAARFQAAGDFTTAPETGALFGRTLARTLAPLLAALPDGELIEPGAGSGRLAEVVLQELAALGALPSRYAILETSPALRAEQQQRLARLPALLRQRLVWIDELPAAFRGVLLANEVLDAMPVHVLRRTAQGLLERGVAVDGAGAFVWEERPASARMLAAVAQLAAVPIEGALFELGVSARAWARTLAASLQAGAVLLADYGDPARALHQLHRAEGTLRCFYRHHVHGDPFFLPGLQDVTAHVDFSAVGAALRAGGLRLHDFDTQAAFLMAHGLLDCLDPSAAAGSLDWLRQTSELQKLVSPAEMGESFKVLVALRDPDGTLAGRLAGPGDAVSCLRLGIPE
ncbi:MAG: SAM-dependent methyltransferase [Pseudomonadota bacterium]|nr:SAM-dependent methyltransferase [Pseudomonadota bacterium]